MSYIKAEEILPKELIRLYNSMYAGKVFISLVQKSRPGEVILIQDSIIEKETIIYAMSTKLVFR